MKSLNNFIQEKLKVNSNTKVSKNNTVNRDHISDLVDTLFNSSEHSGFRKGTDTEIIEVENLKKRFNDYYESDANDIPDEFYNTIKDNAGKEVVCVFGVGYDGTWASVVFMSTNPYIFIVVRNGEISDICQEEDEEEAADKILNFCE